MMPDLESSNKSSFSSKKYIFVNLVEKTPKTSGKSRKHKFCPIQVHFKSVDYQSAHF